jgi:hypothetical protein
VTGSLPGVDLDHRGSTQNLTMNRRYLDPNRVTYEVWNILHWRRFLNLSLASTTQSPQFVVRHVQGRKSPKGLKHWPPDLTSTSSSARTTRLHALAGPVPIKRLTAEPACGPGTADGASGEQHTQQHFQYHHHQLGGLRFDIYAGPFTKNDQLTASPFTDAFRLHRGRTPGRRERGTARVERGGRERPSGS